MPGPANLGQAAAERAHRVQAGVGRVVDVSGDEQGIRLLVAGCLADVVEEVVPGVDQVVPVKPAAHVPVRGMQRSDPT